MTVSRGFDMNEKDYMYCPRCNTALKDCKLCQGRGYVTNEVFLRWTNRNKPHKAIDWKNYKTGTDTVWVAQTEDF